MSLPEATDRPSLRELEALSAMIATRKTVAAAHLLGISQPAVSRAIASLEARIGRPLFERDGGRLQPTSEAFVLEQEARALLQALARLGRDVAPAAGGALRIAAAPTLAQFLLPDLLASWRIERPEIVLHVEIGTNTAVVAAVADRIADIGLADSPGVHPGVRAEVFRTAAAHCVMRADHPLASLPVITPANLDGVAFIALARRFHSRIEAERIFADAGAQPRIVAEAATGAFVAELVRRGVGVALVNPFPVTLGGMDGVVARPFAPLIQYETVLLFPAFGPIPLAARDFADTLKSWQPDDGLTLAIRK